MKSWGLISFMVTLTAILCGQSESVTDCTEWFKKNTYLQDPRPKANTLADFLCKKLGYKYHSQQKIINNQKYYSNNGAATYIKDNENFRSCLGDHLTYFENMRVTLDDIIEV